MHPFHRNVFVGSLVIVVLGLIILSSVQAQTTTQTVSPEYTRLTGNIPLIQELTTNNIPIFSSDGDIRKALELTSVASQGAGFAATTMEPYGLYLFTSDGDIGEIVVYQYNPQITNFSALDCSNYLFDGETENITKYLGVNGTVTAQKFLYDFDCETNSSIALIMDKANVVQNLSLLSNQIKQNYGSENVYLTPTTTASQGTGTPTTTSTPSEPIVSCQFHDLLHEYTLSNGQIHMNENSPVTIGGTTPAQANLFNLTSDDDRLPVSIIIKDGEVQKYLVNISNYSLDGDQLIMQTQLCYYELGWKSTWSRISYSKFNGTTQKFESVVRNATQGTLLSTEFSNRNNLPEVLATFSSGTREKVNVYFYFDGPKMSIADIAFDARRDFENKHYRFTLDVGSMQLINENVAAYKEMSPDQIRESLAGKITVKGQKNLINNNPTAALIKGEGPLNNGGTFDNKYWKIDNMMVPGEYHFTITLEGYRPIEKKIIINPKELSTGNVNKLTFDDIQSISITLEDLKKDRCSACQDLQACLVCTDTAFVDAITQTN